jgi:hypothetical protein
VDVQEEKMVQNAARKIELADQTKAVRKILDWSRRTNAQV